MFEDPTFRLVVIPLLIFLARIVDVSLGTIRIVFVTRGHKLLAMAVGFFEVLVWLLALGQIMQNLTSIENFIAYAGGFAAGNYVGLMIEERLAFGLVSLEIITRSDADELVERLSQLHIGVTTVAARGISGHVRIVYTVVKRKTLPRIIKIVQEMNPKAFVCVQDVRSVREGFFEPPPLAPAWLGWFRPRKGK